jgi:hypothetical protein
MSDSGQGSEPVTREQLYAAIWQESISTVAARYGVSPTYLAGVCDVLRVPRPPGGYWTKSRYLSIERPPLPELPADEPRCWIRAQRPRKPVDAPTTHPSRPLPPPPASLTAPPGREDDSPQEPAPAPAASRPIAAPPREYPRWMRLSTCAEYIDSTPAALRQLVHRYRIPFVRREDGRVFFDRFAIDKWFERGRRRPPRRRGAPK